MASNVSGIELAVSSPAGGVSLLHLWHPAERANAWNCWGSLTTPAYNLKRGLNLVSFGELMAAVG